MTKILSSAIALLVLTTALTSIARGQHIPAAADLPEKPKPAPKPHFTARWFALSVAGQIAAYADVRTTLNLRNQNPGFQDSDPLARPIVNLPTPAYSAFAVALTSGISEVSRRMHKSSNTWVRRFWWAPQTVQIAINSSCAVHNSGELVPMSKVTKRKQGSRGFTRNQSPGMESWYQIPTRPLHGKSPAMMRGASPSDRPEVGQCLRCTEPAKPEPLQQPPQCEECQEPEFLQN